MVTGFLLHLKAVSRGQRDNTLPTPRNGFNLSTRRVLRPLFVNFFATFQKVLDISFQGYNGLVDMGYEKHLRVDHGTNEFVRGSSHINGKEGTPSELLCIEGFWGFSKSRLTRFKGLPKSTFYLHLKECEFRFNNKDENIYLLLLNIIRNLPLF